MKEQDHQPVLELARIFARNRTVQGFLAERTGKLSPDDQEVVRLHRMYAILDSANGEVISAAVTTFNRYLADL